nr:methylaspartate mutase subunit E [uncultured Fusobacterium sp.]
MSFNLKKIQEDIFFKKRKELLEKNELNIDLDFKESIKFQKCLPEYKNFVKKLKTYHDERKIGIQVSAGLTLLDEEIKQMALLSEEKKVDFLAVTVDSYTRENKFERARRGLEESENSNKSMLNGYPIMSYDICKNRKLISESAAPLQLKHGSTNPALLVEVALASGITSIEGGGISHNIAFSKAVSIEESIENWKYADRLIAFYEENGIPIHRESNFALTATLVPPAISNSIQILEGLLAVEQGVKNISLGCVQYGNLIQDVASLEALKEDMEFYCQNLGIKNINLSTVFQQWIGGLSNDAMKNYGVISYSTFVGAICGVDRIIIKNPEEFSSSYLNISLLNTIELTKSLLEIMNFQVKENILEITKEKEQIKRETRRIISKVMELSNGDLGKGIVRAFEQGIIDVPFSPSKYNCGKMMPARDIEGMIRYLDIGNLPFCEDIKEFNNKKINERAVAENREISFQMTVDDIFALSNGNILPNKK